MKVQNAVEEYSYAILRHSKATQHWYIQKLTKFAEWCEQQQLELEKIKQADIRRFLEEMRKRKNQKGTPISSYTEHGYAQVIKGFLSWCSKEDGIDIFVSDRLFKHIEMPKVQTKVIETFSKDQIKAILLACSKEYNDTLTVRDKAIIYVLFDTGIRAGELCGLTLDCVEVRPDDVYIRVLGKGDKWREVGLGREARIALHRYISRYRRADKEEQHVFLSRLRKPLTVSGLDRLIYRLGRWAHIKGVCCSPHTFRHTFAVNFLQCTGDIYKLSRLMGHSSVEVTEVYLKAVKSKDVRHSVSFADTL